ncbi:hypothetical protein NMY22_g6067 [Coprinellus aureogranulatus]|nr:hypothetical protein NMY22_g6067 [Coprinellus aureogranulatus]
MLSECVIASIAPMILKASTKELRDNVQAALRWCTARKHVRQLIGSKVITTSSVPWRESTIEMLESVCQERYASIYTAEVARLGLTQNNFFPTFNFTTPQISHQTLLFGHEMDPFTWLQRPGSQLYDDQAFRAFRIMRLGEAYIGPMKGSNFRLVEGVFPHGRKTIINLLVLLKEERGKFKAVYNVPRISCQDRRIPSPSFGGNHAAIEAAPSDGSSTRLLFLTLILPISTTQASTLRIPCSTISWQLAAKVKAGSTKHIWELYGSFKPEDCTMDLLSGTLNHLRPELIPDVEPQNRLEAETHSAAATAAASLSLLSKLAEGFRMGNSSKAPAISLILASMDGVLKWINFCLDFGLPRSGESEENVAYTLQPELMLVLGMLDDQVTKAFLNSDDFLRTPWNLDKDPIIHILWQLLCADWGNAPAIIARALTTFDLSQSFASATMQRITQICHALKDPAFPDGLIPYAKRIVKDIYNLTKPLGDRDITVLRGCFIRLHHIERMTAMLDKLTAALASRQLAKLTGDPEKPFLGLVDTVKIVTGMAFVTDHQPLRSRSEFLRGGGIPLLARVVVKVHGDSTEEIDDCKKLITTLVELISFTTWPNILKQLLRLKPADPFIQKMSKMPQYQMTWDVFWLQVTPRIRVYQAFCGESGLDICDNPLVSPPAILNSQRPSKLDSSSVPGIYEQLGKALQSSARVARPSYTARRHASAGTGPTGIEMSALTRADCTSVRLCFNGWPATSVLTCAERKEAGMSYGHKARAFHVRMVESLCKERFMSIFQSRVGRFGLALHDFHPIFECNTPQGGEEIVLFKTHPTPELWMHKPDAPLKEKHLWPRMKALGEDFTERMKRTDMRLAEAVFPQGPETDVYVYVLLKQIGSEFKAVYSIPRIA